MFRGAYPRRDVRICPPETTLLVRALEHERNRDLSIGRLLSWSDAFGAGPSREIGRALYACERRLFVAVRCKPDRREAAGHVAAALERDLAIARQIVEHAIRAIVPGFVPGVGIADMREQSLALAARLRRLGARSERRGWRRARRRRGCRG